MRHGGALAIWVLASCYSPRLPAVLRCSDGGGCPSGLTCSDGYCSGHPAEPDAAGLDRAEWEPPQVVTVSPGDGRIAEPGATVTVTFSEAMDPASLNTSSFVLMRGGVTVPGSVSASGNRATFVPQSPLTARTSYTAAVSTLATDVAGNPLPASFIWSFTTDRVWLANRGLDTQGAAASAPHAALNAAGDAVVVWQQSSGGVESIWAARRPAGGSWAQAEVVENSAAVGATPRVGLDAAGNILVVWRGRNGTRDDLWFVRRPAGGAWSAPQLLENDDSGSADMVALSVDDAGDALVVWRQTTSTVNYYRVLISRAPAGGNFAAPQAMDANVYQPSPVGALAGDGTGMVLWDKGTQLWAAPLWLSGAGSAAMVAPSAVDGIQAPALAVAGGGRALAAWTQGESGGAADRVWSARFDGAWSTPADRLQSDPGPASETASAALSAGGAGAVVWSSAGSMAVRYEPAAVWSRDQRIEPGGHGAVVGLDGMGNALSLSYTNLPSGPVIARRYLAGGAWASSGNTVSSPGRSGDSIVLVVTPAGDALAAWREASDIHEAEFR